VAGYCEHGDEPLCYVKGREELLSARQGVLCSLDLLTAFVDVSLCDINRTNFLAENTVLSGVETESLHEMQINFKVQRAKYLT
jgi:hypothetical protein